MNILEGSILDGSKIIEGLLDNNVGRKEGRKSPVALIIVLGRPRNSIHRQSSQLGVKLSGDRKVVSATNIS